MIAGRLSSEGIKPPHPFPRDMQPPGYPPTTVRPSGVSILSVLYFIQGAIWIVGGFVIAGLFFFDGAIAAICGGIGVILGIANFIVGWGLWTLQGWAPMVAIILAILALFNFPIGTLISIITLIYLFQPEIKPAFGEGPPPMAPGYYPPADGPPYPYQYPQYPH